jgi:hypothetical protein
MSTRKAPSLKQQVHELIDQLPDNCTTDDIHYRLYLVGKIRRGEASLKKDGGLSHEDVRKRAAGWAKK